MLILSPSASANMWDFEASSSTFYLSLVMTFELWRFKSSMTCSFCCTRIFASYICSSYSLKFNSLRICSIFWRFWLIAYLSEITFLSIWRAWYVPWCWIEKFCIWSFIAWACSLSRSSSSCCRSYWSLSRLISTSIAILRLAITSFSFVI